MKIQLWSRSYKSHCCDTAACRKSYYTMARCINSQFLVMCSITIKMEHGALIVENGIENNYTHKH